MADPATYTPPRLDHHFSARPSHEPGFGVDLNEKAASRFPPAKFRHDRWAAGVRRPDGALEPP